MTTFYRDDRVLVTSSVVEVDGREYRLADLADVRHDGLLRAVRAWAYWIGRGLAVLGLVALIPGVVVAIRIPLHDTSQVIPEGAGPCQPGVVTGFAHSRLGADKRR